MKTFCENCCVELMANRRKLGIGSTKWLLCPKCGIRIKANSHWYAEQELDTFIKEKNRVNSNNIEEK